MQQKNQDDPFKLAREFFTALQASVATPQEPGSGPRHFSFMRDKVSIALNDEEAKVYRHLLKRLYASLGPAQRECVSRRTVEEMSRQPSLRWCPRTRPDVRVASPL
jgi:hypothetical protein